jgi:PIN domain nuclease of toxin-antitoxin system
MKLLLDTHILLWCAKDILPKRAAAYIHNPSYSLYFSPVSIWEVVIKRGLSRDNFNVDPYKLYTGLLENGYEELNISARHTLTVSTLPPIHKDPFDRLLLAQAISEGISLLTCDPVLTGYLAPVIYVQK